MPSVRHIASHLVTATIFTSLFAATLSAEDKETPSAARKPWTTSRLHGSPLPPEPYKLVSSFPALKFNRPTSIEEVPGQNRLLITEMSGKVFTFPKDPKVTTPDLVIDLAANLPKELASKSVSLFDAELHPNFKENHQLFLCYVHPGKGGHTRVSRFTLTADVPSKANSEEVLITWPSGGHNGGCLEFGKDGMLYISTGDGSGPNPPDGLTSGQDVSDLLGSILRIDVDHKSGDKLYTVPADNPFVENKLGLPEIWAYGLRNPWKFGTDPVTGNIFAADNGWETWEMVHKIVRGGNCGWPVMEGRAPLRTEVKVGPTPILPPVKDHPHTEANSVIGGPVYRGSKLPLAGSFIYGDYITGTIWAIHPDKDNSYTHTTLCDTDLRIVAFTQGNGGEIYVLDYDLTGQIYELVPSGLKDTTATFPRRLSETGLFKSLKTMEPAEGVVPYGITVPRWQDGAHGERLVAIPGDGQIAFAAGKDKRAVYPEGTVFAKHLTFPQGTDKKPLRLETQILHFENGSWHPYSYLWDDAGQDATLVESIGGSRPIQPEGVPARTWHVNAVNECKLCHNAESGNVLGFVPDQFSISARMTLAEQGVFPAIQSPQEIRDQLINPHDEKNPLNARARSYLHVNCSMCHQPGGNAIVSFYLRRDLPFDKLNTHKGTGIGTFGMQNAKIIVPGDPYRSVLMYRMSKLGYARMPYIGSRVVDSQGAALIEDWIRSLPHDDSDGPNSAPLREGTVESKHLQALTKQETSASERKAALAVLTSTSEGALALIGKLHRGTLAPDDAKNAIALGSEAKTDIRGLFDTFIPEAQRRPTLGPNIDPQTVLKLQGNHDRGKLIFFSDSARCRNCHETDDKTKSVGPTLLDIAKKYPKTSDLLEHVLKPSLKIDEPYAAYTLLTTEGQTHTGLLVEKTEAEVVLKTAERKIVRTKTADIEAFKRSPTSLMPDRILSDLTPQEAADLVEYIRSQSGGK